MSASTWKSHLEPPLAIPPSGRRPRFRGAAVVLAVVFGIESTNLVARAQPTPPELTVAEVRGNAVTLTWADGEPAELFVLEGGFQPGEVLASLPVAGAASGMALTLGPGIYYARLHAVRGGARGAASNEVRIAVQLDQPPSAPGRLDVLAVGTDVALSWQRTFAGGASDSVVLDVSGPVSGSLTLPDTGSAAFGGVPPGVYTLSVRARNRHGDSAPTAPVVAAVPGGVLAPLAAPRLPAEAPRLPVRYERFAAPRLAEYSNREQLGAIVQRAPSEFASLLALRDWAAAQWAMGTPDPYPPWDAMTVLDWIRAGITSGFCGQYAQVFLQALAANGIPARYVEIGTTDNPYAHYTTEVWSNDFDKWVLLDVTFVNHFERGGVPLSALEIRDALFDGRLDELDVVRGTVSAGHPSPLDWPQRTAELYYYVRYHLNANHVSAPGEPPFERFSDMVEWLDGRSVPWESSPVPSPYPHERLTALATGERALIEWAPNQIWIAPRRTGAMEYTLDLQHSLLSPHHTEHRILDRDGRPGPWRVSTARALVWNVAATDRTFEVRGVNVKGVRGPVASIRIDLP